MQYPELPEDNWSNCWTRSSSPNYTSDLPYGWAGELSYANRTNFDDHCQLYKDMVAWIKENIKNPKQNVLWTKLGDCIYLQFRKPQDMMWFSLRFGQ